MVFVVKQVMFACKKDKLADIRTVYFRAFYKLFYTDLSPAVHLALS